MDLRYLCDCNDCNSVLINFGHVIILYDIPTKLLSSNSELIYSKFNCNIINIILITNVKSFLGLKLLNQFFNLSSTHVITTSPIYSISTILNTSNTHTINTNTINKNTNNWIHKLINNVREKNYKSEYKLHIISFNQFLTLITTVNTDYSIDTINSMNNSVENGMVVELEIVGYSNGYNFGGCNYIIRHGNVNEKLFIISNSSLKNDIFKSFNRNIFQHTNPNDFILILAPTRNTTNSIGNATEDTVDVTVENTTVKINVVELVNKIMNDNVIIMMDILDECLLEILLELSNRMQLLNCYVYCVGTGVEELFDFYNKSCEWVNESRAENTMDPNEPNSPFPELTNLIQNNILLIANHMKDIVNIYKSPSITFLFHPYNCYTGNNVNTDNVNKIYIINNDNAINNTNDNSNIEYIRLMRKDDLKEIIKEFENKKCKIILKGNFHNLNKNVFQENFHNFGLTKLRIPLGNIKFKQINSKIGVTTCKLTNEMLLGSDENLEIKFGNVKSEIILKELKKKYNNINIQMNKSIKGKNFELTVDEIKNEILINTNNIKDFNTINKVILNLFAH